MSESLIERISWHVSFQSDASDSLAISGLLTSRPRESWCKGFNPSTHETPKWDFMGDPTIPVGSNPIARFSPELQLRKTRSVTLLSPLWDMTTLGTSWILHGEFWSSRPSLTIPVKWTKCSFTKLILLQTTLQRLPFERFKVLNLMSFNLIVLKILFLLNLIEISSIPLGKIYARTPCENSSNTSKYLNS